MESPRNHFSLSYILELTSTADATGYFSCKTKESLTLEEMIVHLRQSPLDEFMHSQVLRHLSGISMEERMVFLEKAVNAKDALLLSLCHEAGFEEHVALPLKKQFLRINPRELLSLTPLIILKSKMAKDRDLHRSWISLFRENILRHIPLPKDTPLPQPFDPEELEDKFARQTDIASIHARHAARTNLGFTALPHPGQTAQKALEILETLGTRPQQFHRKETGKTPK